MSEATATTNGYGARIANLEEQMREGRARSSSSMGLMASWAGIVLGIVGTVGGVVSTGLMRELDRQDVEREKLDTRLQREMRDRDEIQTTRLDAMRERLTTLEQGAAEHATFSAGRSGELQEQVRALERSVYREGSR